MEIYSMETDTLGARIRLARGKTSQGAFAALIGVSKGSLGGYERNENLPNTDVALKICQQTGFSVEWLLSGRGLPRAPAAPGKQEAEPPPEAPQTAPYCARCLKLEEKLEKLEEKLEKLEEERRELNTENRRLWKENSALNARVARLEEQQKKIEPAGIAAQNCSAA